MEGGWGWGTYFIAGKSILFVKIADAIVYLLLLYFTTWGLEPDNCGHSGWWVGVCMRKKGHYHNDTDLFYTAMLCSVNTFAHLSELVSMFIMKGLIFFSTRLPSVMWWPISELKMLQLLCGVLSAFPFFLLMKLKTGTFIHFVGVSFFLFCNFFHKLCSFDLDISYCNSDI